MIEQGHSFFSLCRLASERSDGPSSNSPLRASQNRILATFLWLILVVPVASHCTPTATAQLNSPSESMASKQGSPSEQDQPIARVVALVAKGQFPEALSLLQKFKPQFAHNIWFWRFQSEIFKKLNRYDDAEASINEGLKIMPNSADLYLDRSIVRKLSRRPIAAMEDLNKAIELAPDNRSFYEERISVERKRPEYLHQIQDFDKLIALTLPPQKVKYLVQKAQYLSMMGEVKLAIQVLNQSLDLVPNSQTILNLKKQFCFELQRCKIKCSDCDNLDPPKGFPKK
jgi:tetratricopeptide (TPR) repeat protein